LFFYLKLSRVNYQGTGNSGLNMSKDQFKVAFTGHRHLKYDGVEKSLKSIHADHRDAMWITGGAYGLDSHAAEYALDNSIPLWLVLPFPAKILCAKWISNDSRELLFRSVKECTKLSVISPVFSMQSYQLRNEFMVDAADILAAFFDGSPGGTANCVRYANSVGRRVVMTEGL
jgi:uncharacterized phage-like protein YoqJ